MNQKILAFIYDIKNKKFLILKTAESLEEVHGPSKWFTVTGEVESKETIGQAVKREVKEETNLDVIDLFSLNWGSIYDWNKNTYKELNYIAFVEDGEVVLNEEHIEFEWLKLDEFVKRISWGDDKELLKTILYKAVNKKLYFSKLNLIDYRAK